VVSEHVSGFASALISFLLLSFSVQSLLNETSHEKYQIWFRFLEQEKKLPYSFWNGVLVSRCNWKDVDESEDAREKVYIDISGEFLLPRVTASTLWPKLL
jgi:hypothetical protein